MPRFLGKIEEGARRRFGWYDRYHTTIWGTLIIGIVGFAVYAGVVGILTSQEVDRQSRDIVNVHKEIVQLTHAPCTPKEDGTLTDPDQCRENFQRGLTLISGIKSCEVLQKAAATVLRIEGKPVTIECIVPAPKAPRRQKQKRQRGQGATKTSAAVTPSSSEPSAVKVTEPGKTPKKTPEPEPTVAEPTAEEVPASPRPVGTEEAPRTPAPPAEPPPAEPVLPEVPKVEVPKAASVEVLPAGGGVANIEIPALEELGLCVGNVVKLNCRE